MVEDLIKLISCDRNKTTRIACMGDAVIDIYRYGNVEKMSQEFPIPILHSTSDESILLPGGIANVAYQFKHFNVDVSLVCFADEELKKVLSNSGIKTKHCVDLVDGFIPKKIRYYNNNFPLFRHDIEKRNGVKHDEIYTKFDELTEIDAVVMSDYDKGFWNPELAQYIIQECKKRNIITVVDPKNKPISKWRDCTVLKLNAKEAKMLTGESDHVTQCDCLQKETNCKSIIVTNSGSGFYGKHGDKYIDVKDDVAHKNVNSVIGAGDFFAAMLALALSHKIDFEPACMIAFLGGLEYVKHKHNRPLTFHEIYSGIDAPSAKIVALEELLYIKNNIYPDSRFVWTNGCFDGGLTLGHVECFKYAKKHGDKLIVGINSDESVKNLKGDNRPFIPLNERMKILSAIHDIDYVIPFGDKTPLKLIESIRPHIIIKGGDYVPSQIAGYGICDILIAPYIECVSTTEKFKKYENSRNIPNT
jgi:D-beta-D-heptose 7-phosphate kinase/D-beta-D-heptose 1-phosphate adenosyltransferase